MFTAVLPTHRAARDGSGRGINKLMDQRAILEEDSGKAGRGKRPTGTRQRPSCARTPPHPRWAMPFGGSLRTISAGPPPAECLVNSLVPVSSPVLQSHLRAQVLAVMSPVRGHSRPLRNHDCEGTLSCVSTRHT